MIVECKAGNNRATSMKYVLANPQKYGAHPAIKFSDTNVGKGDGFTTYPIYAADFYFSYHREITLQETDVSALAVPDTNPQNSY